MQKFINRNSISCDAFIRLAVLESKLSRGYKFEKIKTQFTHIERWNIPQERIEQFSSRVKIFADKLGPSFQVALFLLKILQQIKQKSSSCTLIIMRLLCQNSSNIKPAVLQMHLIQVLSKLHPDPDLSDNNNNFIVCCFEFCKLTKVPIDFKIVIQKCCKKIQKLIFNSNPLQIHSITQSVGQENNDTADLLKNFYCIGAIKSMNAVERESYKTKAMNLISKISGYHLKKTKEEQFKQISSKIFNLKGKNGYNLGELDGYRRDCSKRFEGWKKPYLPLIKFKKMRNRTQNQGENEYYVGEKGEVAENRQNKLARKQVNEIQSKIYEIKLDYDKQISQQSRTSNEEKGRGQVQNDCKDFQGSLENKNIGLEMR